MPRAQAALAPSSFVPFGGAGDTRQWVRVASTLLDRIARGECSGRLPGRSALVTEFKVSPRTVQRAVTELAGLGVIYRVPGLGYHVRSDGPDAGDDGTAPDVAPGTDDAPDRGEDKFTGDPRAWVQMSDALVDSIARGELKPGELIPPRKILSRDFGCSRSPVTHALTHLERRGIIRRVPGVGYQVLPAADSAAPELAGGQARNGLPGRCRHGRVGR